MNELNADARQDLAGHISGKFSPQDWELILAEAQRRMHNKSDLEPSLAWQEVVREFHLEKYWGFIPNHKAPRSPRKKPNLGVSLILMAATTATVSKMAVVWLGQNYTTSGESADGLIFYCVMAVVVANFAFFLWRHHGHSDEEHDREGKLATNSLSKE